MTDVLPEVKSFSPRNLQYMNQFFRLFSNASNAKQAVSQLEVSEFTHQAGAQIEQAEITPQIDAQIGEGIVFCIPWGHTKVILDKCKAH